MNHSDPIYQPDVFEPYKRSEQTRQSRQTSVSYNHNFQSQNPISTQKYQPNQMQNEIKLPYYLQQEEIKKQTHKFFTIKECSRITPNDY